MTIIYVLRVIAKALTKCPGLLEICVSILETILATRFHQSSTSTHRSTPKSFASPEIPSLSLESHNPYTIQKGNVSETNVPGIFPKMNYHIKAQIHIHTYAHIDNHIHKILCSINIVMAYAKNQTIHMQNDKTSQFYRWVYHILQV